ncbi:MAG: host-nuclease inhibitor Gam family protein [Selenomonadaceae bacterium]|nr:host-nuclease inhibitor Gam family protein [Selenomonadaceae bacterium]
MEEMNIVDADNLLEQIITLTAQIKAYEDERDALIAHFKGKISVAENICDEQTREQREEIAALTEQLRRFATERVSDKKRSVKLPSGTLAFRKVQPKFYFDNAEVNATSDRLIQFVKQNAPDFLKVKTVESADWANFKKQLVINGDNAFFKDTGEIVDGLTVQQFPDEFNVKIGGI